MSESTTQDEAPIAKKHRWEEADEFAETNSAEAARAAMQSIPATTRWSTATPRQYGHETPRLATPFMGETSTWRGMSTPTVGQYSSEINVATPRFGSGGAGSQTPSMLTRQLNVIANTPSYNNSSSGGSNNSSANSNKFTSVGRNMQTPMMSVGATPLFTGATPVANLAFGATPNYQFEGSTPLQSHFATSTTETQSANNAAIEAMAKKLEKEWRRKNRRLTVEYLDSILPTEFFTPVPVPPDYNPLPPDEPNFYELALKSLDVFAFSASRVGPDGTPLDSNGEAMTYDIPDNLGEGMPAMKPEDAPVFVELLKYHNAESIPDEHLPSYLLMKNLFKLKNGDSAQRRSGIRYLLDKARIFGSSFIFQRMFVIWSANILDLPQKHYFIDFIKSLIAHMNREVRSSTKEVIHMMEPLLSAQDAIIREDGKEVIVLLTRVVGFQSVFDAIKQDFAHDENIVRRYTAKVCAIAITASNALTETSSSSSSLEEEELEESIKSLRALQDMSFSPIVTARQTVARTVGELAPLLHHSLLSLLPELVPMMHRLMKDDRRVKREAALAVASLADACAPYGMDELSVLVEVVCEECTKGLGSTAGPFLQAFAALIGLMSPYDAQQRIANMMPTLVNQFNTPEDEYRRVMLHVVRRCVSADGINGVFIREVILEPFFSGFWAIRRVAADHRSAAALIATTGEMARKLGSEAILTRLVPEMKAENEAYQRMVILAVKRVIHVSGLSGLSDSLMIALLDGAVTSIRQDELGTNQVVIEGLVVICNALGPRLKPCLSQIFDLINSRRERSEGPMRAQAAQLVARIAHTVHNAGGAIFLQDLGRSIYERLEDSDAMALSAKLRATRALLNELASRRYKPSVRELLKKLTFIIHNRFSEVQQNAIALIEDIATKYESDVDAIHLYELATKGLFELLDADRRRTRQACARTFGVIARTIRPFAIILELVDNFRQDKRKIRNCTAIALGAIARACGPFTVIPYLLNEYKVSEGEQVAVIVQHSIMKAIRYIFEFIGAAGKDYIYVLVPLLQRALTETSLQMRRMAVEASRAMIMAIAGMDGFVEVTVHLLNFVHPNIVELLSKNEVKISEERLKMVSAVVSFYEAARLVIGSGKILQYLQQGLFHPARKVRDIYRRTYNMIYIASPESLVPFYPRVNDDATHRYTRYELDVIV